MYFVWKDSASVVYYTDEIIQSKGVRQKFAHSLTTPSPCSQSPAVQISYKVCNSQTLPFLNHYYMYVIWKLLQLLRYTLKGNKLNIITDMSPSKKKKLVVCYKNRTKHCDRKSFRVYISKE